LTLVHTIQNLRSSKVKSYKASLNFFSSLPMHYLLRPLVIPAPL